ncbi:MAG TPA: hypothetical protein PLY23_09090 [Alphaproteobacteria bacterium]|nr:hypothetical protein [Alphaproteobacteria bacterium]HQS94768.1 hypothetical protein [Alphaproteobacteria bacterium]
MKLLKKIFLALKGFQKKSFSFCPFCLIPQVLEVNSACSSCKEIPRESFFNLPFRLVSFYGDNPENNSETAYENALLKIFSQGDLKEKGLDLTLFSPHYPSLYVLSSLKKKSLKPLCYIRFTRDPSLTLVTVSSAFFYTLREQNPSLTQFETFAYKVLQNSTSFNFFSKQPPLVLNLSPLEEILLNVPDFLKSILEKNTHANSAFFSKYIRSTTALWFGRRFLTLLEEVFPNVFYTSFSFSKNADLPSALIKDPFLWILQEWGYLLLSKKPSFLKRFSFEKRTFLKKTSPHSHVKSKSPPTFKKNPHLPLK